MGVAGPDQAATAARQQTAAQGGRQKVTITDVSRELGLSKGTVSRALNGYPDIAEATRARVLRTAERMGYAPLSHAQAIKTGRTRSLGLVIQVSDHDAQRAFLADFLAGITVTAAANNWTLTVAAADSEAAALETMARLLQERKADGFILPRTLEQDPRVSMLRGLDVPFVLFGRCEDDPGCAWFDVLGEAAMREAVTRLAGMGHSRIAFVNGQPRYTFARQRLRGYREGLLEAGLEEDPTLILDSVMSGPEGAAALSRLMALDLPPTAVVFALDAAAIGALRAAKEMGLRPGRDLSLTGYDGAPEGAYTDPPLSTFSVDSRSAGQRLAHLLIRRIRGEAPGALQESAHARFLDRGSAGPPALTPRALAARLAGRDIQNQ